ncbi:acetyltransferase [Aquimarina sp. ERC-38]|uniref:acetyltransferase n=1 Tax=Aquimarina sp. ERC-38 TaxID=2949996 RepID=UPI002246610A|nr:acetyltransferase [Aquimarina sp. ERC-38]UZO80012.1 acetyltransferase [Aquimarina sp. ERC-38]
MKYSEAYYNTYQHLPEELAKQYTNLRFDNHCYLRIALDNTFKAKWDTVLKRPAYKNLSATEREEVLNLLKTYKTNEALLQEHNKNSLEWRGKK